MLDKKVIKCNWYFVTLDYKNYDKENILIQQRYINIGYFSTDTRKLQEKAKETF